MHSLSRSLTALLNRISSRINRGPGRAPAMPGQSWHRGPLRQPPPQCRGVAKSSPFRPLAAVAILVAICCGAAPAALTAATVDRALGQSSTPVASKVTPPPGAFLIAQSNSPPSSVRPPASASPPMEAVPPMKANRDSIIDIWRKSRGEDASGVPSRPIFSGPPKPKPFERALGRPAPIPPAGGAFVQTRGQDWRLIRLDYLRPMGGYLLLVTLGALALFFLLRGRVRIEGERSGRLLTRVSQTSRLVHWFVAVTFILLAVSGLTILFGRVLLMPLIGKEANSVLTSAMMQGHNLFGPLFIVGILLMALMFVKDNIPTLGDVKWFLKGGPLFLGHEPAGKYNGGEKLWFWTAVISGIALSLSGIVLLFPQITGSIDYPMLANLVHGIAALIVIAFSMGHIYLATVVEGTMEVMTTGKCDETWARQHHELWAEQQLGPDTSDRGGTKHATKQDSTQGPGQIASGSAALPAE